MWPIPRGPYVPPCRSPASRPPANLADNPRPMPRAHDHAKRPGRKSRPNARIRAHLTYPNSHPGESAETTLDNGSFHLPIEFLTQSPRPLLKNVKPKCDRKPAEVVIPLLTGDTEKDHLTLAFPHDFTMIDASAYISTAALVFKSVGTNAFDRPRDP